MLPLRCVRAGYYLRSVSVSRNASCPCGSGLKYKRCCLAADSRAERALRFDDDVARRMQDWSSQALSEEIGAALEEFVGPDRTLNDTDLQIFATWFHNDREVSGGGTPAERYAARPELPADERAAAARIASASLGVHRVLSVEPGSALLLEDVVCGGRVRVRSANVSRDAVPWDILIGRVMAGDPPTLWGPTRFLKPSDEPDLIAELERLTGGEMSAAGDGAWHVLRGYALELMRFRPSSWEVEPSFFTLEGDPIVEGCATWGVLDSARVRERFRALGGLAPDERLEMDLTQPRAQLVARRPDLPQGALVFETTTADDLDTISIATLRLEGEQLYAEAMSEQRLDQAVEIVAEDFGELVELRRREVVPIEQRLAERQPTPSGGYPSSGLPPAEERRLWAEYMTERMRRWLDEPHPQLGGSTPRDAVVGARRADLVRLVRGIENGVERARRRGQPRADVTWMRDELGLAEDLAA